MPDHNDDWRLLGTVRSVTFDGQDITSGVAFIAAEGTPFPEVRRVSGVYRPCPVCHYPALVEINKVAQIPPGGAVMQWDAGPVKTNRYTPHAKDCVEAVARDGDGDNGRVYLPANVLGNLRADLPASITEAMDAITLALKGELP